MANKLNRAVARIHQLPKAWHGFLLTKLFNSMVKYAGTSGLKLLEVSEQVVRASIENKKRVQNHIGGVHAVAATLAAESASGIVVGMNVPDTHLPLLKSMTMNFNRRMQGNIYVTARLEKTQIDMIKAQEKGSFMVSVVITDDSSEEPISCQMNWAWTPKRARD